MRQGLVYATLASCAWGLAFVGPLILLDWPGLAVASGRYVAYGIGSVLTLFALARRGRARANEPALWRDATLLTLSGNLLYYVLLSVAVQRAGYVMPTLIVGLLPVTVSLFGRWRSRQPLTARYLLALALILVGLWLARTPGAAGPLVNSHDYTIGVACAFGSLALWTVYGVVNGERMRLHRISSGLQWSSLQGVASLPFALAMLSTTVPAQAPPSGWLRFVLICAVLGLIASWAANTLWHRACQLLPASLLGPVIVTETIAGIVYGALWTGAWPGSKVLLGAAVLIIGIVVAVFERQAPPSRPQDQ